VRLVRGSTPSPVCTASAYRSIITPICMRARPTASSCRLVTGRRLSCRRREGEAAGWSQLPPRPITQTDLATLTEKVRRRVVRWFRMQRLLDADAAADWVGPGRSRTATRPGANGVVERSPFEFLDRLADLECRFVVARCGGARRVDDDRGSACRCSFVRTTGAAANPAQFSDRA
jgi:hypothetical protein